MVFSCTLPDMPCLQPPLYPLKPEALGGGPSRSAVASGALQPSKHCMLLARVPVPGGEQLADGQGVRGALTGSLQGGENAADMRIVPWLLGAGSVQRFPALPLQASLMLMRAPLQLLRPLLMRGGAHGCLLALTGCHFFPSVRQHCGSRDI